MTVDLDALRSRLVAAGHRWRDAREAHEAQLVNAEELTRRARVKRVQVAVETAALAREAIDAGISENEAAALLGVSRARTLRRWLGKSGGAKPGEGFAERFLDATAHLHPENADDRARVRRQQ